MFAKVIIKLVQFDGEDAFMTEDLTISIGLILKHRCKPHQIHRQAFIVWWYFNCFAKVVKQKLSLLWWELFDGVAEHQELLLVECLAVGKHILAVLAEVGVPGTAQDGFPNLLRCIEQVDLLVQLVAESSESVQAALYQ